MRHYIFEHFVTDTNKNIGVIPHDSFYKRRGKFILDLTLGILLLPLLLPIVLLLATVVSLDGSAPIFGHVRVGKNGKEFRCWKIRTMVPDAEQRLAAYLAENPERQEEWARSFKLDDDPRITRFGRFLRRSSLDELPQLFNVFKGEMSLVGPRPVVRAELARYGTGRTAYESCSPGVTGLWQISGRNDLSYHQRVALDLKYARSYSLLEDIRIILMTSLSVVKMTGK